jgi:hypothetical protein
MNRQVVIRGVLYEIALICNGMWPVLMLSVWLMPIIKEFKTDWNALRANDIIKALDEETEKIKAQWEEEEYDKQLHVLVEKASSRLPEATITPLRHTVIPSIMIETPPKPDASEEVKKLGGEMRITYVLNVDNKKACGINNKLYVNGCWTDL